MFNNPNKSFYFLLTLINIKLTSEYKEINNILFLTIFCYLYCNLEC